MMTKQHVKEQIHEELFCIFTRLVIVFCLERGGLFPIFAPNFKDCKNERNEEKEIEL